MSNEKKQLIIELTRANRKYHSLIRSIEGLRIEKNKAYRELFDLEIRANALDMTREAQEIYARTKKEVRGL